MAEDIFCGALDHFFVSTNASTALRFKVSGSENSWMRRFQKRRRRKKKKAFSINVAGLQQLSFKTSRRRSFF